MKYEEKIVFKQLIIDESFSIISYINYAPITSELVKA